MNAKDLKLAIVGHVDHGKSTLIGRMLYDTNSISPEKIEEVKKTCESLGREMEFGFILDHLEEEREQGITIDTTQIFFTTKKRDYVIIDAPGHKEFLKNMITGASQAEGAILIVDANEGVQEQTRRHAYILSFLGIEQITVVINKMDLINYDESKFLEINKELDLFLDKINVASTYVIPISAKDGDNIANKSDKMNWYKGLTVLESLDTFKIEETKNKPLRMPVQDVYKIDDERIVVGRIESGTINQGQEVIVIPTQNATEVRDIKMYLDKRTCAEVGESIGLTTEDPLFLERGNVICDKENPIEPRKEFKAEVFWMDKESFSKDEILTFKCATQESSCKIKRIIRKMNSSTLEILEEDSQTIKNTEAAEIIIATMNEVILEKFSETTELGRFVLVKNDDTIAGGIIKELN